MHRETVLVLETITELKADVREVRVVRTCMDILVHLTKPGLVFH